MDTLSRALHFYIKLPNKVTRDITTENDIRYINWKYRPGERVNLKVQVDQWNDQIVVPKDGIVQDGAEYYVFLKKGNTFTKIPVHVLYNDQDWYVIENDGSLKLGWKIAFSGAYQIYTALKNNSGGGMDPHAGHNH